MSARYTDWQRARGHMSGTVPLRSLEQARADLAEKNAMARQYVQKLVQALRLHKAWSDGEKTSPDYGGQTRDTHPDGEKIWRIWWDNQLDLCDRAIRATDEVLARTDELEALLPGLSMEGKRNE